ncbi:hypothetical protein [Streptomyces sp. NPDC051776]|uniref:hypothetical protein n=1 Tax=Streptomyces sp. NPDC051776 TaxID=3155414 RepID=UPI00344A6159
MYEVRALDPLGEAHVRGTARRRMVIGLVIAVLAAGAAGLTAATAGAGALCPGRKVKTLDFSSGKVQIYKSNRIRCAVTLAKSPGKRRQMSVSIQARGSHPSVDSGRFTHHAGPVTVNAWGRCVFVRGSIGSKSVKSGWLC